MIAHLSNDPKLLALFTNPIQDIFYSMAADIYGKDVQNVRSLFFYYSLSANITQKLSHFSYLRSLLLTFTFRLPQRNVKYVKRLFPSPVSTSNSVLDYLWCTLWNGKEQARRGH